MGILLCGALCQSVYAQGNLVELGTSTLADSFGTSSGPEALVVSWAVLVNPVSDVYTYYYNLSNPANDVLLNQNGTPTSTPETINSFQVAFNATAPGALIGNPVGGTLASSDGTGISWYFSPTVASGNSVLLAFQSDLGPGLGNAAANGANPPGPWSSTPSGQPVPVPRPAPEPATLALLGLAGLLFLPYRSSLRLVRIRPS